MLAFLTAALATALCGMFVSCSRSSCQRGSDEIVAAYREAALLDVRWFRLREARARLAPAALAAVAIYKLLKLGRSRSMSRRLLLRAPGFGGR
jgi:hypothetical protein